jgi:hypothetical protein
MAAPRRAIGLMAGRTGLLVYSYTSLRKSIIMMLAAMGMAQMPPVIGMAVALARVAAFAPSQAVTAQDLQITDLKPFRARVGPRPIQRGREAADASQR